MYIQYEGGKERNKWIKDELKDQALKLFKSANFIDGKPENNFHVKVDIENFDAADQKEYLGTADPQQLCGCEPPPPPTTTTTTTKTTTTTQKLTIKTTTTTQKLTTKTTPPPTTASNPIFQCPDEFGSFPHPDNCMKFYECDNWTFYEKSCSKGTLWDDGCKYPYQVNCSDRKIPTENQIISSPKRQTGFFLVRY